MLSLYELIIRSPTKDKRGFASRTTVLGFFCRLFLSFVSLFSSLPNTLPFSLSLSLPLVPALYPWHGNKNNLSCGELWDKDRRSWRVLGEPVAKRRSTVLLRGVCYQGGSILFGEKAALFIYSYCSLLVCAEVPEADWCVWWEVGTKGKARNRGEQKLTVTPIGHQYEKGSVFIMGGLKCQKSRWNAGIDQSS